jgi:predicted MFS family arabinose efflux permease
MIGSDVLRGITVLILSVLAFSGRLEIWHVYPMGLAFGIINAFFNPAFFATVPAVVDKEDLSSANSLNSLAIHGGRILGPPLGAAMLAVGGASLAFAFNGLTFLVSAVFHPSAYQCMFFERVSIGMCLLPNPR